MPLALPLLLAKQNAAITEANPVNDPMIHWFHTVDGTESGRKLCGGNGKGSAGCQGSEKG